MWGGWWVCYADVALLCFDFNSVGAYSFIGCVYCCLVIVMVDCSTQELFGFSMVCVCVVVSWLGCVVGGCCALRLYWLLVWF